MQLLDQWFARVADRIDRICFLEDALLTRRYGRYVFFRLRYFLVLSFAEAGIHIIEFTILAFMFDRHTLILAILLRTLASFVSSWWWGALEIMREDIRALRRDGKSYRIDKITSRWMCSAAIVAFLVLIAALVWIIFDTLRPMRGFTVFHLYVLAIAVQVALAILSRTYHSIVYAVRRVYRPLTALLGVRAFAFVGTIVIWPAFGLWSFPIMLLFTSVFSSALTFHYVRKMYRALGFEPLYIPLGLRSFRALNLIGQRKTIAAGFAYAGLRLDTLIILVLFPNASTNPADYNFFLFFYLISPFVRSAYGWAQLFYFDLKRLESGLLINLKRDFERFIRSLSWWVGGFFWIVACVVGTLLVGQNLGMVYLVLGLFFIFRSRLAFAQIRLFAENRYGILIFMAGTLIATVIYQQWNIPDQTQRFGFYAVALMLAMIATVPIALRPLGSTHIRGFLSLTDWVSTVLALDERVRIRSLKFAHQASDSQIEQTSQRIKRTTKIFGATTRVGRSQITWFETGDKANSPLDKTLIKWSGGLLRSIKGTDVEATGVEAFAAAQRMGIIDSRLCELEVDRTVQYNFSDLAEVFMQKFPDGLVFDLQQDYLPKKNKLSQADYRSIMLGAVQYSKDFRRPDKNSTFDVSALLVNGQICLIFAVPMKAVAKARNLWRDRIKRMNLALTAGARTKS